MNAVDTKLDGALAVFIYMVDKDRGDLFVVQGREATHLVRVHQGFRGSELARSRKVPGYIQLDDTGSPWLLAVDGDMTWVPCTSDLVSTGCACGGVLTIGEDDRHKCDQEPHD